jgi:hypothetical protein
MVLVGMMEAVFLSGVDYVTPSYKGGVFYKTKNRLEFCDRKILTGGEDCFAIARNDGK